MKQTSVKVKFGGGLDANRMMMRRLAKSFVSHNNIKTTLKRAKALKSYLDKLVTKSKVRQESNKNFLLRELGNKETVDIFFNKIGPSFKDVTGGFIKLKRLGFRETDGADSAQVLWAHPLIVKEEKQIEKNIEKKTKQLKNIKNKK